MKDLRNLKDFDDTRGLQIRGASVEPRFKGNGQPRGSYRRAQRERESQREMEAERERDKETGSERECEKERECER